MELGDFSGGSNHSLWRIAAWISCKRLIHYSPSKTPNSMYPETT